MAKDPEWDERAWQAWLRDPGGPVMSQYLPRVGRETETLAKARFHRRTGATADSIGWKVGQDQAGPWCRVGGSFVIRFLEKPARQMHQPYRWLSDALREVASRQ